MGILTRCIIGCTNATWLTSAFIAIKAMVTVCVGSTRRSLMCYPPLSTWRLADDRIEQAMLPAHRWLDRHVLAKLTILLVMALACCGALWYVQMVIPYHNQHML